MFVIRKDIKFASRRIIFIQDAISEFSTREAFAGIFKLALSIFESSVDFVANAFKSAIKIVAAFGFGARR